MENPPACNPLFAGKGQVRALLRGRDWRDFPFGHPNGWPPDIHRTIRMVLDAPAPMGFYWGPDCLYFYNDAYIRIMGDKHPAALARPIWESWEELREGFGPVLAEAQAGKACNLSDIRFTVVRDGVPETAYFSYALFPVFDARGDITGILNPAMDTTATVVSNRRREFQLRLGDLIRTLTDPGEVVAEASALLGEYLGVDRVVYVTVDETGAAGTVGRDWTNGQVPSLGGTTVHLDDYGVFAAEGARAGKPLVVGDATTDPRCAPYAFAYAAVGVRAVLAVPLLKNGRLRVILNAHAATPHHWTSAQIGMAEDMLERTWTAVENVCAQAELRDADRRKDEFLAMLAHELRNPLAPISAAADLLQLGKVDEERVRQTSLVIGRQVRHMTSLVDDLLDVSRVTRGLAELHMERLDIHRIVNDAIEQVTPLIRARRHRLALELVPEAPLVMGDRNRLVQVFANLLNNAAKYTPEGGHIGLRIEVRADHVLCHVTDTGIGMAPDLAARAFDLFSQAERSSDRSSGGLGLGLALVKSLVHLHGGTVTCASPGLGQGSTFTVCLPRVAAQAEEVAQPPALQPAPTDRGNPLHIMVVDDNVDAAAILAMLLESAGHRVEVHHGAVEALARSRAAEPPQVFLLDIGLPVMDGNELAQHLRAQPATCGATLIAITGYGQENDRAQTAAAGFDHHLVKPVDIEELFAILAGIGQAARSGPNAS